MEMHGDRIHRQGKENEHKVSLALFQITVVCKVLESWCLLELHDLLAGQCRSEQCRAKLKH